MKRFFYFIYRGIIKLYHILGMIIYCILSIVMTLLVSCEHATPTTVPPLAESLGYQIPNVYGITTVGLNEFVYKVESEKLNILRIMINIVNEPALEGRKLFIDFIDAGLAAGFFGGLPLALRRIPKNAVKKTEAEKQRQLAGRMDPEEFIKQG